jgi:hypothetical protein
VQQPVDRSLLGRTETTEELVPDCALPNVKFSENALDKALLYVFRKLVSRETGYASTKEVRTETAFAENKQKSQELNTQSPVASCWPRKYSFIIMY